MIIVDRNIIYNTIMGIKNKLSKRNNYIFEPSYLHDDWYYVPGYIAIQFYEELDKVALNLWSKSSNSILIAPGGHYHMNFNEKIKYLERKLKERDK